MLNYRELKRRYELDGGPRTISHLSEALREKHLKPEDFSLRDLAEALVPDGREWVRSLDPRLPSLMRSIFQAQPDVAHVYLGSKRSMMRRLFNDANEPFWRSAHQLEPGLIPAAEFAPFLVGRFEETNRRLPVAVADRLLELTGGHPYATQELAYALWEETPRGRRATDEAYAHALVRSLARGRTPGRDCWQASR